MGLFDNVPIFPRNVEYGNTQTYLIEAEEFQFGKGTFTTRLSKGYTSTKHRWNVQFLTDAKQQIEQFLRERKGVYPFRFYYNGKPNNFFYICSDAQRTWSEVGLTTDGVLLYQFSAVFEEIIKNQNFV